MAKPEELTQGTEGLSQGTEIINQKIQSFLEYLSTLSLGQWLIIISVGIMILVMFLYYIKIRNHSGRR